MTIEPEPMFGVELSVHLPIIGMIDFYWEPPQKKTYLVLDDTIGILKAGFSSIQEAESWCLEQGYAI